MWLAMILLAFCLLALFGLGYLFMWAASGKGEG